MKRPILFSITMLALTASTSARAQDDGGFCANLTTLTKSAQLPTPFSTVTGANGAATLEPVAEFEDCQIEVEYNNYTCFLPIPAEQMPVFHEGLGQMIQECIKAQPPYVEPVEPALLATGKLPYLSFDVPGMSVGVSLYPRQDWGAYADEAWDEEFTRYGFSLVVSRR